LDLTLLKKHIDNYKQHLAKNPEKHAEDMAERKERCDYYKGWTKERILAMTEEEFFQYVAKLWAMLIWGNKKYVIDKMINENGFNSLRKELAELVWGGASLAKRWDTFKEKVKGFGPATISEILCHTHPGDCMLWNRRAYVGFDYLGIKSLPRYDYQLTGQKYVELSGQAQKIADELVTAGVSEVTLLTVDYLIWDELQVVDNLSKIHEKAKTLKDESTPEVLDKETSDFIHNEIRDKLANIGQWLGFKSSTEIKVADGSKVDTIWEATIGNMGRVIYVFEVQTKGNTDSLIINLLKALNNPAVQGVVAVSDAVQLEKISKHAKGVPNLGAKLKCWEYKKVLEIHDALEMVYESINNLKLVPLGF